MRVFDYNSALVRRPGRSVVNGLRAGTGPSPRYDAIVAEHTAYIAALREAGVEVTVLDALEQYPDALFVEDPALVFSEAAILLRPGAPSRSGEAQELSATLASRFPTLLQLPRGFADGGDILVTPERVLIGQSARTDRTGADALRGLLAAIAKNSQVVDVPAGTLHLKSDCSLLDEETVLATESLAASDALAGFRVLVLPGEERAAANALRVNDTVFLNAGCPRTLDILTKRGLNVVPLPVSEISKIDAGLSCLSLRWFSP